MRFAGPALVALTLVIGACGGPAAGPTAAPLPSATLGPSSSPGALPAADVLCQLLTPADWAANGLTTAGPPRVDSDEPGSAYCVYRGTSGGTGGLELDVFVTASIADASVTYETIMQSIPELQVVGVDGAQEAVINPSIDDSFGAILVRAGKLAFTITAPASDSITTQLTALALLMLGRASALV